MRDGLIAGFERRRSPVFGIEVDVLVAGEGRPLLLHGYPQTCMICKAVASSLTAQFTVVAPDRAGWAADRNADENRRAKRKMVASTLVLWGERRQIAALRHLAGLGRRRTWARVSGVHFIFEEAPDAIIGAFRQIFA